MIEHARTHEHERALEEHVALLHRLRDVAFALNDRYMPVSLLTQRLADLRDQLSQHFIHEERTGLFAQIMEKSPRLRPQANKLLQQHLQLYSEIAGLTDDAHRLTGTQMERDEVLQRFDAFRHRLAEHEQHENLLLQELYCGDIGSHD